MSLNSLLASPGRAWRVFRAAALPMALAAFMSPAAAQVVISQVYGGGGNSGATLRHDFIELKNRSTVAESVGGWSVQYASGTGSRPCSTCSV
jgi:predicted extracellular nuclease